MNATAHAAPESERLTPRSRRAAPPLVVHAAGHTDRGHVRETNEDHHLVTPPLLARRAEPTSSDVDAQLLVVADGMGGHVAGERASGIAVRTAGSTLLPALEWLPLACSTEDHFETCVLGEMRRVVERAHAKIREEEALQPELTGMGTTLTMAYRHGARLFIAHVGDSRCYVLRGGQLMQITHDHTLVSEMIRAGLLSSVDEAQRSIRSVLTNALGGGAESVKVETHRLQLQAGDMVLLCSDGLTGMISDVEIAAILGAYPDVQEAAERLVSVANEAGGQDNITAVVARCEAAQRRE